MISSVTGTPVLGIIPRPCGLTALHAHGDAHAAADAKRCKTFLGVALLHLVQQGDQDAGTRGPDWMADGDRTAVDVHFAGVPTEILVDGAGLRRERLVGLNEIEVVGFPPGLLQSRARSGNGTRTHN